MVAPLTATCEICGSPFPMRTNGPRSRANRFCTRECWRAWVRRNQVQAICQQCGNPAPRSVSLAARVSAAFCTPECHALSMHMTLADHIASGLLHEDFERVPGLSPCWTWTGPHNPTTGYGLIRQRREGKRTTVDVHRAAWEVASGQPVPDGLRVLHVCDVPLCARNDDEGTYEVRGVPLPRRGHLFLGTHADNMADMWAKGRGPIGDRNGSRKHIERMARGEQRSRFRDAEIIDIRTRYAAGGITHRALAEEYGTTRRNIGNIIQRRSWTHL